MTRLRQRGFQARMGLGETPPEAGGTPKPKLGQGSVLWEVREWALFSLMGQPLAEDHPGPQRMSGILEKKKPQLQGLKGPKGLVEDTELLR